MVWHAWTGGQGEGYDRASHVAVAGRRRLTLKLT